MKPELAIYCNQVRPPVEGLERRLSHNTLDPKIVLTRRCTGVKKGTEFEDMANQLLAQNEICERELTPATINDILIYLKTGAEHKCHR